MGRQAERVYTDQATIEHFNHLVCHLQNGAHVRLHLHDGSVCEGLVTDRPTVQQFYDGAGTEGINGIVHLEHPGIDDWAGYVWFDQIASIEHLDADADRRA